MNYEKALDNCIFRYVSGSKAYGTDRPDSDEDIRGVFMAPIDDVLDLFHTRTVGSGTAGGHIKSAINSIDDGAVDCARDHLIRALEVDTGDLAISSDTVRKNDADEELHELRKFLKLAAECNPNIIEFLYIERGIKHEADVWKKIKQNRHLFLNKRARYTFSGYALAQANRIKSHRSYLLNPPTHKPTRAEFGLLNELKISKEHQGAILTIPDEWISEGAREYVRKEKAYKAANDAWKSYKSWEQNRNPVRKEYEAKYGYDVKHSMHLVRLIRMAKEILRDGEVLVYRPDREELKGILRGEWTYEQMIAVAESADAELDALYKNSTLPHKPDYDKISDLYASICEEHYGIKLR